MLAGTSSFAVRPPGNSYYRGNSYAPQPARPTVTDDFERWYTEPGNQRMVLSVRSGIQKEVHWALDRLLRISHGGDNLSLRSQPGLIDALFDWADWYATNGHRHFTDISSSLFVVPEEIQQKRRNAIVSLLVIRNCTWNEQNLSDLQYHSRTLPFILTSLYNVNPHIDENCEFVLHTIDFLFAVCGRLRLPTIAIARTNPLEPLQAIASTSKNRPTIISALQTITALLSVPENTVHLSPSSPALEAAIRYLPLFIDSALVDACLNYLHIHLSSPSMLKAFMSHKSMPGVLRVLVCLLIHEQVEERASYPIAFRAYTTPANAPLMKPHKLTTEEREQLLPLNEPERCYEWMKFMFETHSDVELAQTAFWNLYRDAFVPIPEGFPEALSATEVIKNVTAVFPEAKAVISDDGYRFVVRGLDRRKDVIAPEPFKCRWNRGECGLPEFPSLGDLFEHVLEHITAEGNPQCPCLWSNCPHPVTDKASLRGHVLTHLSIHKSEDIPPSQSDRISLAPADTDSAYPIKDPTLRQVPPLGSVAVTYPRTINSPSSAALTALLCIRFLFRASFASQEVAPRADADHFGFPGVVEETEDADQELYEESDSEAERRGRRAFIAVRQLMEQVRIQDEVLMGWIAEMVDAGLTGRLDGGTDVDQGSDL